MENIPQRRHTIVRHLENEGLGFYFQKKPVQHPCQRERHGKTDKVHSKKHGTRNHRPVERLDEGSNEQNVNRQPRRTAHERSHENRCETRLGIAERAGGHHSRNRTGIARQERHEAAAVEPAPAEKLVHKECGAGHVAGVLKQRDEEKQNQNLRKKNQHAADSGNDAVAQ